MANESKELGSTASSNNKINVGLKVRIIAFVKSLYQAKRQGISLQWERSALLTELQYCQLSSMILKPGLYVWPTTKRNWYELIIQIRGWFDLEEASSDTVGG